MPFLYIIIGVIVCMLFLWWRSVRRRYAPIRHLIRNGMLSEPKCRAFFQLRNYYQRSCPEHLTPRFEVDLALLITSMTEEWALAVNNGVLTNDEAFRQLGERIPEIEKLGHEIEEYSMGQLQGSVPTLAASSSLEMPEKSDRFDDMALYEQGAFWALNNTWKRFMGGPMQRPLQDKLTQYVRGFDEERYLRIRSDWETARDELCKWAVAMLDCDCPEGAKLSTLLRDAKMAPTDKRPWDLDPSDVRG